MAIDNKIYDKLPRLLKVLIRLHEFYPDKFPEINDPYYLTSEKLMVWLDTTGYNFDLDNNLAVLSWEFQDQAGPNDHKWQILLTLLDSILTDKSVLINLYGFTFRYFFTDFLTTYVTKRNKKEIHSILDAFGLKKTTIYSYLRNKDIDSFRQKRKKLKLNRKKDFSHIKPISDILAKAWSLDHLYMVENIIKDKDLYNRIINCSNSHKLTRPKLNYDDIIDNYSKVNRAISKINERKLNKDIIDKKNSWIKIDSIVDPKYFLLRNFHKDDYTDWTTMHITSSENGGLIFQEHFASNIGRNASKEIYVQLVSQFTGNPNSPILITDIPLRFNIEGFFSNFGFCLSRKDAKKILELFN